ncbi:MAG: dTMP kinase [Candidatus Bilamarchaeaceae archaeon]
MFVVLEGIDGCGKDTQIQLLRNNLQFEYFKYPTSKFTILNDYLNGKVSLDKKGLFLLFLADIADEQEKIANANFAIADRYVYSTIAYELGALSFEKSKEIVEAIGFIKPDLVLLLDISPETAQKRKAKQKKPDIYESNTKYLKEVRERFLRLAKDSFHARRWIVINADAPIDQVNKEITKEISKLL